MQTVNLMASKRSEHEIAMFLCSLAGAGMSDMMELVRAIRFLRKEISDPTQRTMAVFLECCLPPGSLKSALCKVTVQGGIGEIYVEETLSDKQDMAA